MAHEELGVRGQIARRLFEVYQPAVVKAVRQEGVHVAVDQIADEHPWSPVRLESPQTVVWRLARSQIGHREHRVTDSHSFATLDQATRKGAGRRPLVPKHGAEN